ncbi:MAG: peptidylprolyl isomerase, partial [Thermoguttaceae bacterium]|nr:peptidylprolyl isomerase [Thermoguttaceae bacterium]
MEFSRVLNRFFAPRASRRSVAPSSQRRRMIEVLENRRLLSGDGFGGNLLPEEASVVYGDSIHYILEGTNAQIVDESVPIGLNASVVAGRQVAFTVMKAEYLDTVDGVAQYGPTAPLGEVVIQLFEADAPLSTSHFKYLVNDGYYDGKTIHRIIGDFMFQGGSSDGAGYSGAGASIADEHSEVLLHNARGIVAFANAGANTSDAQFYVTFDETSWLDGGYNVFGIVVDGYDVLDALESAEVYAKTSGGEKSTPYDLYSFADVRVLETEEVQYSVVRLNADADAVSSESTISIAYEDADGVSRVKDVDVTVVGNAAEELVLPSEIEMTAGEVKNVDLPTTVGDVAVSYVVTAEDGSVGYSVNYDSATGRLAIAAEAG